MQRLLIRVIEFYQKYLSFDRGILAIFAPGGACCFPVSCSEYTKQAIKEKGVGMGIVLGLKRVISCNSFTK